VLGREKNDGDEPHRAPRVQVLTKIVVGMCKFKAMEVLNISHNEQLKTPGLIQLNTLLSSVCGDTAVM
jgi:hypothetical protein